MPSKIIAMLTICAMALATKIIFAATLELGSPSVILTAGQTVEIPLSSTEAIASDLTANGAFQSGDVSFTAGPGCHLSSNGCTLMITASPNSKNYMAEPVIVSESAASNKPIFMLSIINPNGYIPHTEVAKINWPTPIFSNKKKTVLANNVQHNHLPITLTAGDLSAVIEPHGTGTSDYSSSSNGPVYQLINITNNGAGSIRLDTPAISGTDASSFSIDTTSSDYAGSPTFCNHAPTLANGDSCKIIITSTRDDPRSAAKTATLTISDGISADTLTFTLKDTTYVYAAGGFDTLGAASVTGGDLLAECTAGTCFNALQDATGNNCTPGQQNTGDNCATTNYSVGQWINALALTPTGNLMVGGVFGAIGGAVSGASSGSPSNGKAALLAQCTPGPVAGNACINQINQNGSLNNAYAFNNAYIDAITPPFAISSSNYMAVGGDFNQIRAFAAASSGRLLAKCQYSGTTANSTCNTYIGSGLITSKYANNTIAALDTLGSTSGTPVVNTGGLFTQIAGSTAVSTGTTFGSCTSGSFGSCTKDMGSNNPDSSILGMTDDGSYLYMGGAFTRAGNYTDSSGGYPLVRCSLGSTTACTNALTDSNDANGYIEGLSYSGGNFYVGGRFTTIGDATEVNSGNMLAVCHPGNTPECSNFVSDTNPYASGTDWGGMIAAIAVGNQTTVTPN